MNSTIKESKREWQFSSLYYVPRMVVLCEYFHLFFFLVENQTGWVTYPRPHRWSNSSPMFFLSPPGETCRDHRSREVAPPSLSSGPVMPPLLSHSPWGHGTGPVKLTRYRFFTLAGRAAEQDYFTFLFDFPSTVSTVSELLVMQTLQWVPGIRWEDIGKHITSCLRKLMIFFKDSYPLALRP